jgi:ubiquinone/menaquinone biosynthesis C-methylase UbiE
MSNKPTPQVTLPDDSERMIPAYHKGKIIYGEHITRYVSAQELVKDKVVLDIASGSGYGTNLLAQTAKHVYGVDVSEISVEYAKQNYGAKNIEFLAGDGEKIPLKDNSVDIVTTFETIEHIPDYRQFMNEVSRILKDDGLLVISTPNDLEFAEGNHFHLHEFEYEELKSLIAQHFKYTESYFQGTWLYNALVDEDMMTKEQNFDITTMNTAPISREKCIYFYILCSNRKITEKVKPIAAISEHWSAREEKQGYEDLYRKQELSNDHIKNLEYIISLRDQKITALEQLAERLAQIEGSRGYKALEKLRKVKPHRK